ncbi:MAG TPA: APA family fibronectin-binding glycoprotein [Streptosporangiaceae bacterium]
MDEPDAIPEHRKRRAKTLAMATLTGATVVALTLPSVAQAEPAPSPSPAPPAPSGNTFMQGPPDPNAPPPPVDPAAPAPAPADPNAPPPPAADPNAAPLPVAVDPNAAPLPVADPNAAPPPPAPEPGRVDNAAGGFSYVVPAGWKVSDATQLSYGQALLTKAPPEGTPPEAQPPNDTSVLLGRLDMKLFAGAEADNAKAATRLASDMGEFFMPFPGTRINQASAPLTAGDMPGAASSYEVKFTDTTKPNGQIWAGVVGHASPTVAPGQSLAPRGQRNERWFVVWLGTANHPVDKAAAVTLAQSIRPWSPPPPPPPADPAAAPAPADPNAPPPDPNAPPPDPNAPAPAPAPDPNAPPPRPGVGVGVPVDPATAPGMLPPA